MAEQLPMVSEPDTGRESETSYCDTSHLSSAQPCCCGRLFKCRACEQAVADELIGLTFDKRVPLLFNPQKGQGGRNCRTLNIHVAPLKEPRDRAFGYHCLIGSKPRR